MGISVWSSDVCSADLATDQPAFSPDRDGDWQFYLIRDFRFIDYLHRRSLSMANRHDRQVQKMGAMTARDPPGVEVAPWRADRQPDQGLKLGDRAGACRGGKADALARNGGHDRGVMQDGTAHFMEIVEEMAVDPIGPRAQGHATNRSEEHTSEIPSLMRNSSSV